MKSSLLLSFLLLGIGCGGSPSPNVRVAQQDSPPRGPAADAARKEEPAAGEKPAPDRKIIQTGHVEVAVADFEKAFADLKALLAAHEALVMKSEFTGGVGHRRGATWTVKVPAPRFGEFVDALVRLGRPVRHSTDAQDVTEEFVDLQARLHNMKEEEKKLNELMQKKAESNADLLTFRKEIRTLRGEIEASEGRLNVLSRLTALSTVHLSMYEERDYAPPASPNEATFATSVKGTWDDSLGALARFGKSIALVGVALAPWLPILLPAGAVAWWLLRRRRRAMAPLGSQPASQPT